jgi:sulfane dehydrogenase subunit SoxC
VPVARYLWSYGCDHGEFGGTRNPAYLKDLPLARVREGGCLVAYELNGDPLPAEHGFPARLVVPGYYGTNSVKWLYRMTLADRRAGGPFTTVFYNDRPPDSGGDTAAGSAAGGRPVWAVPVESVIVVPGPGQRLGPGTKVEVWGWAWAASGVAEVVVSDDGVAWQTAEVGPRTDWSWQRFRTEWILRDGGRLTLRSRATARDGQVQPLEGARNAVHQVEALVA